MALGGSPIDVALVSKGLHKTSLLLSEDSELCPPVSPLLMIRFFPLDGTMTHLRRRRKACPSCSAQARYHHEARASTCADAEVV